MNRLVIGFVGLLFLVSCGAVTPPNSGQVNRRIPADVALPNIKVPAGAAAVPSNRSNQSIAQEFLQLAFQLESGRRLPVLSRFEGPITLRVTGQPLGVVSQRDLDRLLTRLRKEARINISQVPAGARANITVELLSRKTLRRAVPQAACFVAPRIQNWREFTTGRRGASQDWTTLQTRDTMAIFLPSDVSPQEVRDCLHEEIAQALGPVNDLYHLTDSIFNDDNFHTVLTGFDMVILRAFYDPALHSGMTFDQVARKLPAILARINPNGRRGFGPTYGPTSAAWRDEIQNALGTTGPRSGRLGAAKRAVSIARQQGWHDNRLGFALYAQGRLALSRDPNLALASFAEAENIFLSDPETRLHAAHVAVQGAALALSRGQPETAIRIADANSPIALQAENPNLLATFLMLKAQALDQLNKSQEADIVRLDSLAWARYGMGSTAEIRTRLREIAALPPRRSVLQ